MRSKDQGTEFRVETWYQPASYTYTISKHNTIFNETYFKYDEELCRKYNEPDKRLINTQ